MPFMRAPPSQPKPFPKALLPHSLAGPLRPRLLKLSAVTAPHASSPPPPPPRATQMPFRPAISTPRISSILARLIIFTLCFPQIDRKAPSWKSQVKDTHVLLQSLLNTYSTPSLAQANTQLLLQMTVKLQLMFNKNYMLTFYLRHTPSKSPTGETEK